MSKNNRTDCLMYVEFNYNKNGLDITEEESVYIPFPIFVEAFRKYADRYKMVGIDGTDNAIWNLLVDLDAISTLEDDNYFIELCKELYKGSEYEEDDYEYFCDEVEMLNEIGEYAVDKED